MCLHHSGPPNRLRPAFKASTLSLGMRGSTIATTIAHSIDTHGWARISLPGYTNLVPDRFFACASASGKNPPTKILIEIKAFKSQKSVKNYEKSQEIRYYLS